jgi:hypothetical protein
MIRKCCRILLPLFLCFLASCAKSDKPTDYREYSYNFNSGTEGWDSLFSDYPKGEESFYELEFSNTHLPEPLDTSIKAIKISGNNHSDDLLSFITTRISQLIPNAVYEVTFDITLASKVATNSAGIGGSPDLAIGAGGLGYEPVNLLDSANCYRTNFISLLQSHQSNNVMQMIGTIGVQDTTTVYTLINRNNTDNPIKLKTSEYGELWLLIGTDSGFEGITTLYYRSIDVKLRLNY